MPYKKSRRRKGEENIVQSQSIEDTRKDSKGVLSVIKMIETVQLWRVGAKLNGLTPKTKYSILSHIYS
jgi:hypothetical protein